MYLWYASRGGLNFLRRLEATEPGTNPSRVFPEDRYQGYLSLGENEQNYAKWCALSASLPLLRLGAWSRMQACDLGVAE